MSEELNRTEMTRNYLNRLKTIDKRIKIKLEEAEKWHSIAENHTGHISEVKVQTSPKPDKMAEAVVNALHYEQESYELAKKLVDEKNVMLMQIFEMDEKYCLILNMYFMQNMSYKKIQDEMDYSFNNVKSTLRKAIKAFGERYSEEVDAYTVEVLGKDGK